MNETTGEPPSPAGVLPDTITIGGVVYRRTAAPPGYTFMQVMYQDKNLNCEFYVTDETRLTIARTWNQGVQRIHFPAFPCRYERSEWVIGAKTIVMLDLQQVAAII